MHTLYQAVCDSLSKLENNILANKTVETTLMQNWGWNTPALDYLDIAAIPRLLREKIENGAPEDVDDEIAGYLNALPVKIQLLIQNSIPQYLFNGNAAGAFPVFIGLIDSIDKRLTPYLISKPTELSIDWEEIKDKNLLPRSLLLRLKGTKDRLDNIAPDIEKIEDDISSIRDAREAADQLPTTMADLNAGKKKFTDLLKSAKEDLSSFGNNAAETCGKIDEKSDEATRLLAEITNKGIEAEKIIKQCHEAYRVTTTVGLAASFDDRALKLSISMWIWVIGLLVALGVGADYGTKRIELLSQALSGNAPDWGVIWLHIILSLLSVGAPLWFAWMSTKQISQRFKLAEDYAFKASVAKAYEGYRREAARIDPEFEARLFSSALTRLEEAPLRLVDTKNHGSPGQEFIDSKVMSDVSDKITEFKETILDFIKTVKGRSNSKKNTGSDPTGD